MAWHDSVVLLRTKSRCVTTTLCRICHGRRACNVQLELSNDYQPETEYQGVLSHPHTTVLDSGAIGHNTLLPYTSDVSDGEFLQSADWFQLPYGSCLSAAGLRSTPPQRSPASCVRSRPPPVTVCGLEAYPMPPYSPPPASPRVVVAPASSSTGAVTSTPTIKTARHNSLSSSFSNLI